MPAFKSPAHAKASCYKSEQVKVRYHQCANLGCLCSFNMYENITRDH
ncbi:ogr/Delta-like zinc finger family protein [Erwinia sp. AnSW2-5]